ncbi:MAG: precorrin-6y C5,15-methyltransferase (decarboxylating) subunit CbiE [Pirellula sp.]|jgi:precorrin-6Y C5,15-methyltransferase (decarboxylating)|nr:precorrin-6y C5,15-methyltransferase (decarboxylating) subunit CbiE [Pirellula sp.]
MTNKIWIIGIGDDGAAGLTKQASDLIHSASLLVGSTLLLEKFPDFTGAKESVGGDLDRLANIVDRATGLTVVLASGDPLFYGTARFLCDRLGKDRFEVLPHVSSMQLAFARVKESWDEAYLTNVASQPIERVIERIRSAEKVGVFTSEEFPPARLAEVLIAKGIGYFTAYVCENLGSPDERVTRCKLSDIVNQKFSPLNVMVLVRQKGVPDQPTDSKRIRLFGNPDEIFRQAKPKRELVTACEVRSIALSEMKLRETSIIWDIGAGSGSVSIEAAQIARHGKAYAIEMDPEDYNLILENAARFGVENVVPVLGEAPTAWQNLPDPEAIFVGGTGRAVTDLVEQAWPRLQPGGCLVANMMSMDNVVALQQLLTHKLGVEPQLWMIQISRGNYQMERLRLEAANPTFLVKATKG